MRLGATCGALWEIMRPYIRQITDNRRLCFTALWRQWRPNYVPNDAVIGREWMDGRRNKSPRLDRRVHLWTCVCSGVSRIFQRGGEFLNMRLFWTHKKVYRDCTPK